MKLVKALLALLLVFGLVACSNSNEKPQTEEEQLVVSYETFTKLYEEYGAKGVNVVFTEESGYQMETDIAQLKDIDESFYESLKATLAAVEVAETEAADGALIARVDLKNRLDLTYLNIYENNVIGVRRHPEEVFYTVSAESIEALLNQIEACYGAYAAAIKG